MNFFRGIRRTSEDFVDDLFYGKDEDIFARHHRRREFERRNYGLNRFLVPLVPLLFAYGHIRDAIKDPEYTPKQKAGICTQAIGCELMLDVVRIGGVYLLYKLADHSF